MTLSHLDESGRARMVDVGDKPESRRTAVAEGQVRMSREAYDLVAAHAVAKGDVLAVAEEDVGERSVRHEEPGPVHRRQRVLERAHMTFAVEDAE